MINTVLTKKPRSTKDDDLRTFVRFKHGDLPARFTGVNSLHRKMRDYCLKDGMSLGVDVGVINVTFDTIKNAIESVLDDCLKGLPFFLPPLPSPLFFSSSFFFHALIRCMWAVSSPTLYWLRFSQPWCFECDGPPFKSRVSMFNHDPTKQAYK